MGKGNRRRQSSDVDSQDSTPSEVETTTTTVDGVVMSSSVDSSDSRCPHVGKSVSVPGLKKTLRTAWTKVGVCGACAKNQRVKDCAAATNEVKSVDPAKPVCVLMCLRCGIQLCDANSSADHFTKHLEVPRSDLHCLSLNVMTWKLWCHDCKAEVRVDSYKKVREAVDLVRKIEETKGRATTTTSNVNNKSSIASATSSKVDQQQSSSSSVVGKGSNSNIAIPKARGLTNLGNTCFFNAVMQSLTQTHPLTQILDRQCQNGATFNVPAVQLSQPTNTPPPSSSSEPQQMILEAMQLQLAEGGALSLALTAFAREMGAVGKQGVVNPGHLFGQLCRKAPQFRGFQQHDSHELLRHLLEGLRSEEVKRQKSAILKQFGLNEKTDPKSVESDTKRKLQALGRHSTYTVMDKIFGGHLVSTIVCEQCHNSSQIYEPFLDISLPLIEEKPQRPGAGGKKNRGDGSQAEDDGIGEMASGKKKKDDEKSKSQMKKDKARSKKEKRKGRKGKKNAKEEEEEEEEKDVASGNSNKDDPMPNKVDDDFVDALSEETKMKKELEENEKNETSEVYFSDQAARPDDVATAAAADTSSNEVAKKTEETDGANQSCVKGLELNEVREKSKALETTTTKGKKNSRAKKVTSGNDEDDEDDGYSEGEEDWEWDYGEEWEEGGGEKGTKSRVDSENIEAQQEETHSAVEKQKLVSINPLPQELLDQISAEREKSSDPQTGDNEEEDSDDPETGASSNGDVEDNLDEQSSSNLIADELNSFKPFRPDPQHLDPHMERLCRSVRNMSVASVNVQSAEIAGGDSNNNFGDRPEEVGQREYVMSGEEGEEEAAAAAAATGVAVVHRRRKLRLQNDWVARSLTSIAARYQSKAGECSVYSCLTQFTSPELLTGNNKWACDRCAKLQQQQQQQQQQSETVIVNGHCKDEDEEEDETADEEKEKKKKEQAKRPPVVYSNASKQLLIFSPPAVLTIHLKRFQQTVFNLRKVNRHVEFPLVLDLAPFCSSTAVSTSNVKAGVKEINYELYAVVEHSGRLQGGHYTAFVKVRQQRRKPLQTTTVPPTPSADSQQPSYSDFYSSPTAKTEEIHKLLVEIERKCREEQQQMSSNGTESVVSSPQEKEEDVLLLPSKWFHISDSHVSEVSEDKVHKSQAYILFYERIK